MFLVIYLQIYDPQTFVLALFLFEYQLLARFLDQLSDQDLSHSYLAPYRTVL